MVLLDTHVVIWLALEPGRISKRARAAIQETHQRGEGLAVSDITLLEIATIESKGRIKLNASLEAFLTEIEARFVVLPITGRICARIGTSGSLSQGSSRPRHWSNSACRGTFSDYCR